MFLECIHRSNADARHGRVRLTPTVERALGRLADRPSNPCRGS